MTAREQAIRSRFLGQVLPREDRLYLLGSLAIQITLGLLFGHAYDDRIYMATGYLVAHGLNPYIPQDLTAIFNNSAFKGMTSIGYPPPLPLLLGLIYLASYALVHNLLLYNLAIKLPIILANLGLANLVRKVLSEQGADDQTAQRAWLFLLFNPFVLYFTTAWGQFDSVIALLTLLALVMLYRHKVAASAALLAVGIAAKPLALPVALVVAIYLLRKPYRELLHFMAIFSLCLLALTILPFVLFHWDPGIILQHWNAIFTVSGGMSLTTFYELLTDTYLLPGDWWLSGMIWAPAVLLAAVFIRGGSQDFRSLLKHSLALILVFYLTRTWLSEPNLMLILPMVLILTSLGELPKSVLILTWVLPLVFTVFNTSPPQLLFPILPDLMTRLLQWMDIFRAARLEARMLLVIPWLVTGWWMVVICLRKPGVSPQ